MSCCVSFSQRSVRPPAVRPRGLRRLMWDLWNLRLIQWGSTRMTSLRRKNITGRKTSCANGCSRIFIYLCPPPLSPDNVWPQCIFCPLMLYTWYKNSPLKNTATMNVNMVGVLHLSLNQESVVNFSTQCFQSLLFPLRLLNKQLEAKTADILRQSEQLIVSFSVFSETKTCLFVCFLFLGIVVQLRFFSHSREDTMTFCWNPWTPSCSQTSRMKRTPG